MKTGNETINRNMVYVMLMLFVIGVMVMLARGGGSTFFMFFWVAPMAFWVARRYSGGGSCETDPSKRKNDDVTKRKNDETDSVGTLTTMDGEVFDIVEEKSSRRDSDFI
jgi:hypothetical protein